MHYHLTFGIWSDKSKNKAAARLRDALGISLCAAKDAVEAGLIVTPHELPEVLSQIEVALRDDGTIDNRVDYSVTLLPKAQPEFYPVRLQREQIHTATFAAKERLERRNCELLGEIERLRRAKEGTATPLKAAA